MAWVVQGAFTGHAVGSAAQAATGVAAAGVKAPGGAVAGVDWLEAASDADIDRAFAQARQAGQPVLLYWGASWCPPCNQLKATLFNRQDFIDRARRFVAVHVDGDAPGAQKLGGRFKVRGYPTLILLAADGTELTRLPGEVDAPKVMAVLQLGLAGGRPVKAVLADARVGGRLSGAEWQMLAWYAWDVDRDQLVPEADRADLLADLARRAPGGEAEARTRLLLKAVAASSAGQGLKPDDALRQRVLAVLADARASRAQMDVLVNGADDLARALAPEPGAERERVVAALGQSLQRLQADASLSRADRLSALLARVELARLDQPRNAVQPTMDAALQAQARSISARLDREVSDTYERQAVITAAAHLLGRAGLWDESNALLQAGLARSHAPYYLMSQLGGNARQLGRNGQALDWFERAWSRSEGPATRLQWGASYVAMLTELAPDDEARIERAAAQIFREAATDSAAFHERSARSLQRIGSKLKAWNGDGTRGAVIGRLRAVLAPVCAKLDAADPQRATCQSVFGA